jgi:hypothetical protein
LHNLSKVISLNQFISSLQFILQCGDDQKLGPTRKNLTFNATFNLQWASSDFCLPAV